jgi:DNA-binding transcriptional MocR family regulator
MRCRDITVLVTTHTHHTVMAEARRLGARMILVPVAGVASLRRAVLDGLARGGAAAAD